jgi:hypothetical protein
MNTKKAAVIGLSLALLTGCSSEKSIEQTKSYTDLEDMYINSPITFKQSKYEIESKYKTISKDKGSVTFILNSDKAYGDMLCEVQVLSDNFGPSEYIEISGPYEYDIAEFTVTFDMDDAYSDNGTPWESSVSCMLHPAK